jgi:hypothetical protein
MSSAAVPMVSLTLPPFGPSMVKLFKLGSQIIKAILWILDSVRQDLPHHGIPTEPTKQPYLRLSFQAGALTSQDRELQEQDIEQVQYLYYNQKDVVITRSFLEKRRPTIYPLICLHLLHSILPQDTVFRLKHSGIRHG